MKSDSQADPSTIPAVFLHAPVPIELLALGDVLTGQEGTNRARGGHSQINANTDRDAVLAWLARFVESPNTYSNARKESERLLLWALIEQGKPLSSLTHEDLLLYRRFLADPQPAERWIHHGGRKMPRSHPGWRPFAGPLSAASQTQAMVTLNSLLSWLVQAGYLAGNPLALSRQRHRHAAPRITRLLDEELWECVKAAIQAMPMTTTRELAEHARVRWLFSLLYLCGLRISEVVGNPMGNFFCRPDRTGEPCWWLQVLGKGSKTRLVPGTHELMVELTRYRLALGLPRLPQEHDSLPLLLPVWWKASTTLGSATGVPASNAVEPLTRAAVHGIVKSVFNVAAQQLEAQGENFKARATRLRAASAHWLRHTASSHMADKIDLRHVRDTLGHASISTTSLYLHTEDDKRHQAIEGGHRLGWTIP